MKTIEYFFECYFNMSADYSELEKLVMEFTTIENENYIASFKEELSKLVKQRNYSSIVRIASCKGGRRLTIQKAKILVNYLLVQINGDKE